MRDLVDKIIAGEWGVSHGLLTAIAISIAWLFVPFYYAAAVVAISAAYYWAQREAKARGTWDIRLWYRDSQLDAIVPAIVSVMAIFIIYL